MILIKSNANDFSTTEVLKWLYYFNKKFVRFNNNSIVNNIIISNDDIVITAKNNTIKLSEINKYWYRRGGWKFKKNNNKIDSQVIRNYLRFFNGEAKTDTVNYIERYLFKKSLNSYITSENINKLAVLRDCRKIGIQIPETLATNCKKELKKFIAQHPEVITKAVNNLDPNIYKDYFIDVTTKIVNTKNLKKLPEKFNISLFQNLIEKEFEIRTFFLVDTFYSMAIFSQNDEKTKVDFRNYNLEKPNRTVPYRLPNAIEIKLRKLLKKHRLNSGSIDMIYSKSGEYIFLEINPVGQYGMVSIPCNYYLDLEIANYLSYEK